MREGEGGAGWFSPSGLSDSLWPHELAPQAPLSLGFPRQEYWSGLPFHSPGNLPDPGIELRSPVLQMVSSIAGGFFTNWATRERRYTHTHTHTHSVQVSCSVVSDSLQPHGLQHARLPCPSLTPGASQTHVHWVRDAIQPSHPWSLPSPLAFSLSQHQGLFQWVSSLYQVAKVLESIGQNISASASVLLMNIQDWFPLGWTGWIFLQSKGLSRVFSYTTVQKHQFFGTQLSL